MKTKHKCALGGIAFGLCFPIISVLFLFLNSGYTLFDLRLMHKENPLLYIIDTAPLILGFMAFVIGKKKEDNIIQAKHNTENSIKIRTQALSDKNSSLRKEILEREIVEQKLKKATKEAIHAKNVEQRFLANMSHEIRTPLNSIIGFSKILANSNLSPETMEYFNTIKFASNHLLTVVNDILDMSKINSGEISFEEKTINLESLIKNAMDSMELASKNKQLSLSHKLLTDKDLHLKTDPLRLHQVLSNLLKNAVKFTSEGSVQLVVNEVSNSSDTDQVTLRFEIIDTGIGISEENVSRVFEDFAQAETGTTRGFGGTGLGLSISKKIVELQHGKIGVYSELGVGSNFWFEITFEKSCEKELEVEVEKKTSLLGQELGKRIKLLIAEDNEMNRFLIKTIFEAWSDKFTVTFAHNGLEAFEHVQSDEHDLILMDLQMPVKDGFESTEMIRALATNKRTIPIIALTADVLVEVKKKALEVGMNEFLTKPIQPDLLLSTIYECLDIKTMSA